MPDPFNPDTVELTPSRDRQEQEDSDSEADFQLDEEWTEEDERKLKALKAKNNGRRI
jgi:hypothetical protein